MVSVDVESAGVPLQLKDSHAKAASSSIAAAESKLAAAVVEKDIAEATVLSLIPCMTQELTMPLASQMTFPLLRGCPSCSRGKAALLMAEKCPGAGGAAAAEA